MSHLTRQSARGTTSLKLKNRRRRRADAGHAGRTHGFTLARAPGEGAIPSTARMSLLKLFSSSAFAVAQRLRTECGPSAGQDGPLLYPGPLCGGEVGTTGPRGSRLRMSAPFRQGRMPCRKARPQLTDLPGRDARQAPSGMAFLFGYLYSLATQRESNSGAAGARKLSLRQTSRLSPQRRSEELGRASSRSPSPSR